MFTLRQDYYSVNRLRPLPHLATSYEVFAREWDACYRNPARPTNQLYEYLKPHVQHWVSMLVDPAYPKDISYCCLVNKVEVPEPIEATLSWAHSNADELQSLVSIAYLQVLRGAALNTRQPPRQQCYVMGRLVVYYLAHMVRDWQAACRRENAAVECPGPKSPSPQLLDLLIDIKHQSPYKYYLITLFLSDHDRYDMLRLTGTTSSYANLWSAINEYSDKKGSSRDPEGG